MRGEDMEGRQERDLVLAPNEFAFILDETKGNVTVYVGSNKTSLANTDKPVIFSEADKTFDRTTLERAVQPRPRVGTSFSRTQQKGKSTRVRVPGNRCPISTSAGR
jgi:hypothetical protein